MSIFQSIRKKASEAKIQNSTISLKDFEDMILYASRAHPIYPSYIIIGGNEFKLDENGDWHCLCFENIEEKEPTWVKCECPFDENWRTKKFIKVLE